MLQPQKCLLQHQGFHFYWHLFLLKTLSQCLKQNTWNKGTLESFIFTSKSKLNSIASLDLNNFKLVEPFDCYWLNKKDVFDFAFLQWSRFFGGKIFRLPLPTFLYSKKYILREGNLMLIQNQMQHKVINRLCIIHLQEIKGESKASF